MNISELQLSLLLIALSVLTLSSCSNPNNDRSDENSLKTQSESFGVSSQGMDFFHGSFEDALALAAAEEKLVFVDVYTIWCGPCVVMQETVFPLPEVGEFFNARFVNFKLDAENEEQNGPELAAHYDIGVVPTYLILDHEGNELSRASSALPSEQFITLVSQMLSESESDFHKLQARYDAGERSTEFMQHYLLAVTVELSFLEVDNEDIESVEAYDEEMQKFNTIADEYFSSRPYSDLINKTDVELIMQFRGNVPRGDPIVEFVIANFDEVLKVSSNAAVCQFVLDATLTSVAEAAKAGDKKFTDYIDELNSDPLKKAVEYERARYPNSQLLPERMKYSWEVHYLLAIEDWKGLHELYKNRFEKSGSSTTARGYSYAARNLVRSDDLNHREVALDYSKRAYAMDPNDLWVAAYHVTVLMAVEKEDEAQEIFDAFESGLTESQVDQETLVFFRRLTPVSLHEESEEASSSEQGVH